jgi:hypothetical protein
MPIDLRNLEQYRNQPSPFGLFNEFWHKHGDADLSGGGLNEITVAGAEKLAESAKKHKVDGTPAPVDQFEIDSDERALMKALLEHPLYSSFFEQDAKVKVIELFGLDPAEVHLPHGVAHPKDEGEVALEPRSVSQFGHRLANADLTQLADAFSQDYRSNTKYFEDQRAAPEERARRTLSLLKDYATALWSRGEQGGTEAAGNALLDEFAKTRSGKLLGSKNFNGAPWSVAQSLMLGLDPNKFEGKYPKAHKSAEVTYLSMNDGMAKAMSFVDEWLSAKGLPKKAEAYEKLSPLGWLLGIESGHLKKGNLNESRPFSTSGLNWGVALFPNDRQIAELPPKQGFEFPIDCLDSFNNFITCRPDRGERLAAQDDKGHRLTVEKVIHEEGGKAVSWSAKFTSAGGQEVEPSKVVGVILDRGGRVKGDGKVGGEVNMWWWGFCDRNTAQQLYKSKFQIPQLDRETIKVKAGDKIVSFPKAEAQKLIDADIPDIVTNETMCGFRFNDEPQQVVLKNGQRLMAKVPEAIFNSGATTRIGDDMISIHDGPKRPLLGVLEVKVNGAAEEVAVKDIVSITKGEGNQVTIKLKEGGYRESITGDLEGQVPWNKAAQENGQTILKQTEDFQIRGGIKMTVEGGAQQLVATSDIVQIVGEMQKDLRISQYMVWIEKNGGMFATDASLGEVVSNGMRWVNKFTSDVREGEDRPEWAPEGELTGLRGPVERVPGDKVTFVRAMFAYQPGQEATSEAFQGFIQTDKSGRIVNEGFISGQPDFGWSADGPLDWTKASSFNPHMSAELRVALLVNGVKESGAELEALAKRLNLPANYKDYLVAQD